MWGGQNITSWMRDDGAPLNWFELNLGRHSHWHWIWARSELAVARMVVLSPRTASLAQYVEHVLGMSMRQRPWLCPLRMGLARVPIYIEHFHADHHISLFPIRILYGHLVPAYHHLRLGLLLLILCFFYVEDLRGIYLRKRKIRHLVWREEISLLFSKCNGDWQIS